MDTVFIDPETRTLKYDNEGEPKLIPITETKDEIEQIPSDKITNYVKTLVDKYLPKG